MTRAELYDLVWQTPMTKLAKQFGLSDVGLRKICVKYDIPTPPIGYWAKRAHGKRVRQPALPAAKSSHEGDIHLVAHDVDALPAELIAAQESVLARDAQFPPVVVPAERPRKLHDVARATATALHGASADHHGMKTAVIPSGIAVSVGRGSVERVVCIVEAVARAAELRGYSFQEDKEGNHAAKSLMPA